MLELFSRGRWLWQGRTFVSMLPLYRKPRIGKGLISFEK